MTATAIIITAAAERTEAIKKAMKHGYIKTHDIRVFRAATPTGHPVSAEEVAGYCLDAPDLLPAGGFVSEPSAFGLLTIDSVDRR